MIINFRMPPNFRPAVYEILVDLKVLKVQIALLIQHVLQFV